MKKKRLSHFLFLLLLCLLIPTTCKKLEKSMLVSTGDVTNIATNSADVSGSIIDLGGGVKQHGHCYAKTPNVTTSSTKTDLGVPSGNGGFTSQLKNLEAGTLYYVKAYVSDGTETSYGDEISFTTTAAALPTITTTAVTSITTTTATSGGSISSDGGATITMRGVCWNTATGPSISDSKTTNSTGTGSFVSSLTGLTANTTYYVRAYATNSAGTAYGDELSFTTSVVAAVVPTLTTTAITSITQTTATCGGNITSDGGASVTGRGVCWSNTTSPTIAGNKTVDGTGSGVFVSSITGLAANTKYYVRAYATNSAGTGYGDELSFTTSAAAAVVSTLTTTAMSGITQTGATSGGNITSDGGASVTARGVCWGTTTGPTISGDKTSDATGSGVFVSSITGLTSNTKYYVRAYATNSVGTAYGDELSFTTSAAAAVVPTLTTTAMSGITQTGATSGGNITSDGGAAVTARGVCWSLYDSPSTSDPKTSDGFGTGTFISNITGLTPGTLYHVRAYALNSAGVSYGGDVTFTTNATIPTVTTAAITAITTTTASSGGEVTSNGGAAVTVRGVCWNTATGPSISNSKTTDGAGTGSFTSNLSGLIAGTQYYVRAYATNSKGTAYGNEISFTTTAAVLPTLSTTTVNSITGTTASSGGNITSDGGAPVTARGICWKPSSGPAISDSKTNDGTSTGTFTSALSGLTPNTSYYVRAYATNLAGTNYGNEVTFTSLKVVPSATTTAATDITQTTVILNGTVNANNDVTSVYFDYGLTTSYGATYAGNPSSLSSSTTTPVNVIIPVLTPNTTYHFRVWAQNSAGATYGSDMAFTTAPMVADVDGNVYTFISIGTQVWLKENLKTTRFNDNTSIPLVADNTTWAGLTSPGYCWYNNDEAGYKAIYGALYNWYTVDEASNSHKNICPIGWHVPNDYEWTTLTDYLGGGSIAGGKMKEAGTTHWGSPNTGADNSSGLTALPGGYRNRNGTSFLNSGYNGYWWSTLSYATVIAWYRQLSYNNSNAYSEITYKSEGVSIRCLKD